MDSAEAGPSRTIKSDDGQYLYLASLNAAQLQAVISDPSKPLQILAGPGSGKTRVLTARVAYLVQHHRYRPHEITAVTFTNKAANEMKKRLKVLLNPKDADALTLGTFHATCARYLRRYAGLIDLSNNFAIADADDCKKIMYGLLKAKSEVLEDSRMSLKHTAVLSEISKAKAKEESPDGMAIRAASDPNTSTSTLAIIAELYAEYEQALRDANSLDLDDLLVFGVKLFRTAPKVLDSCKHVLVDEFQDTNATQYELMKCFAKAHGGVSVVGDPDQSIYGWRSAEVENLNKMTRDFPSVEAIYLEENYRSTGSILAAAHSIVSQDRERIPKNLFTSHPKSTPVTLKTFSTPLMEASFIATEIKRLIAYSGGVLNYGDFGILLRYNALSRNIESSLQKDSIPNRIVGGHKFFERMEIKDMLAYVQLAENPGFTPAFIRVVNVPRRAIGDKSVADLLSAAKSMKISPMELSERIIDGAKLPAGIKPGLKKNLASFVGVVRKLRRAAERGTSVADLLRMSIEKTGYEDYLRTSQQDFESRWENVKELITYSVTVAEEQSRIENGGTAEDGSTTASAATLRGMEGEKNELEAKTVPMHSMFRRTSSDSTSGKRSTSMHDEALKTSRHRNGLSGFKVEDAVIEVLSSDEEIQPGKSGTKAKSDDYIDHSPKQEDEPRSPPVEEDVLSPSLPADGHALNPLTFFLRKSMLSTDTTSEKDDASTPKVTITTVHAAKGLEWPVVFIPAVEQGTYPSYRCTEPNEIAEERRLLYVAMTRAQVFLTISYCQYRMMGGEDSEKLLCEFVSSSMRRDPPILSTVLPDVDIAVRRNIAKMLGRPPPDEEPTKEMIMKHVRAAPPLSMWDAPESSGHFFNRFARREVTKAARAAEYWSSDFDEYALPEHGKGPKFTAARSAARSKSSNPSSSKPPAPPPVKLPPSNHKIPEPLPFTFGLADSARPQANLGHFTDTSSSSLALMKSLGLPGDDSPFSSPSPNASPQPPSVSRFHSMASSMSDWKTLGPPEATASTLGPGVQLAKGTKRLGMGRPAPWAPAEKRSRPG